LAEGLPDSAPATALFPQLASVYDMVAAEVEGLTPQQLDFESDQWEWSKWSIRHQVGHMAAVHFRHMLLRWGKHLFPLGPPPIEDLEGITSALDGRWLDESKYREMDVLLEKLRQGLDLIQSVLAGETVGSLRGREIVREGRPSSQLMVQAHPSGFRLDPQDPTISHITLEYTIRHLYFEDITHLYNIQRLKRAQELSTRVQLPHEGYWVVPGWDTSEP